MLLALETSYEKDTQYTHTNWVGSAGHDPTHRKLKVSKMECKIVTIGLSRDDSPKRQSIRVTENSVRVSSDDGTTKSTLWPPLHAICEWRMYVIRFIFEACDRISHTYKESYDVKIKFTLITKAWKGNRVNKSALPVRHSTHWIIKLTMCLSYQFFNSCLHPRPWIWTHKTTSVKSVTPLWQ